MKRIWLYLPLVCLLVMGNVLMAQAPDQEQKEEKPAYPTTGPRFVVCSPTGTMVKTPLYVKIDKDYLPLNISSRFPSERVTPESDGTVNFYEKKPSKKGGSDAGKEKLPPPYMVIRVPREYARVRSICIVVPGDKPDQNQCFFLRESEFPTGGFHIINFSPSPLEIFHSFTNNYPEKGDSIAPYRRKENNGIKQGDPNTWSYVNSNPNEPATVNYAIMAPPLKENGSPLPLRMSRFMINNTHAEINIIVRHPKISWAYSIISLQYAPDSLGQPSLQSPSPSRATPSSSSSRAR